MDSKIILGEILQRFSDEKVSQVKGFNSFRYIKETNNAIHVTREAGKDTSVPFSKLLKGIEAFCKHTELYNEGPASLRKFGITHVTSPVWSLLHLLPSSEYRK